VTKYKITSEITAIQPAGKRKATVRWYIVRNGKRGDIAYFSRSLAREALRQEKIREGANV